MTIKSKKARTQNLIYFISDFTPDQNYNYELKCHLIATPASYGISSEYILHDLQLDGIEDGITAEVRYLHKENSTQVLVVSIVFPPDSNFFFDYILLHCGQADAKDLNYRDKSCANVEEILLSILNRQKGIHCESCIYNFQKRLSGKCGELYSKNRYQNSKE